MIQSNIFAQVASLLEEKQFSSDCSMIVKFLGNYKSGEIIYPKAMRKVLNLNMVTVYAILELLTEKGFLEQRLGLYCQSCHQFTGDVYKTFLELPKSINCAHCNTEIENPMRQAIVIYQVK